VTLGGWGIRPQKQGRRAEKSAGENMQGWMIPSVKTIWEQVVWSEEEGQQEELGNPFRGLQT